MPNITSVGASNAAGVLSYCVKNKLVSQTSASSVLAKLTGQTGVTTSPAFALGQTGVLQTGATPVPTATPTTTTPTTTAVPTTFSIASLKGQLRNKACDAVLKHGTSLL